MYRCSTGKLDSEEEKILCLAAVSGQQERCLCRPCHPAVMAVATALAMEGHTDQALPTPSEESQQPVAKKKSYASHRSCSSRLEAT